jgi:hypothetical protein
VQLGPAAGQLDGGAIVIGDLAVCVGGVDRGRQGIEHLLELEFTLPQPVLRVPQRAHVHRKAAGVDELAIAELDARSDLDVADRSVLGTQAGRVLVELLAAREAREDVLDHGRIGVELADMAADVILGGVSE